MTVNQIETTDGLYHTFAESNTLVGITSGATTTITKVYDISSSTDNTFTTDLAARNFNFEDEADDIIDGKKYVVNSCGDNIVNLVNTSGLPQFIEEYY